jgi:hypothetical protein
MQDIIEELRRTWPALFAGTAIDEMSGDAIKWATIQNKRSRRELPDEIFVAAGRRVLVRRDAFLDWWQLQLRDARQPFTGRPRHRPKAAAPA